MLDEFFELRYFPGAHLPGLGPTAIFEFVFPSRKIKQDKEKEKKFRRKKIWSANLYRWLSQAPTLGDTSSSIKRVFFIL